jgi:hypothetical protein
LHERLKQKHGKGKALSVLSGGRGCLDRFSGLVKC